MKKIIIACLCILLNFMVLVPFSMAQDMESNDIEMGDSMRSEGKIYVVVLVVVIVFTGLIAYTINTDRKLNRIEKEVQSLKSHKDS